MVFLKASCQFSVWFGGRSLEEGVWKKRDSGDAGGCREGGDEEGEGP